MSHNFPRNNKLNNSEELSFVHRNKNILSDDIFDSINSANLENYIETDELSQCGVDLGIDCISLNICSLNAKIDELRLFVREYKKITNRELGIIFLQEIWQINCSNVHLFNISGFTLEYIGRPGGGVGGGVAIYVANFIKYSILPNEFIMEQFVFEALAIRVEIKGRSYIMSTFYRSNKSLKNLTPIEKFQRFMKSLQNWLNALVDYGIPVVLTMDSNLDLLRLDCSAVNSYYSLLISYGFQQLFYKATRFSGEDKGTLIDNVFVNGDIMQEQRFQILDSMSDHNILLFIINCDTEQAEKCEEMRKKRVFTDKKVRKLQESLGNIDWGFLRTYDDVDDMVEKFHATFFQQLDTFCPAVARKNIPTNNSLPFFNEHLRKLKKEVRKLKLKFIKSRTQYNRENYTDKRNLYNHEIRKAKRHFFSKKIEQIKGNARNLWSFLKTEVGMDGNKRHNRVNKLISEGREIIGDINIANEFCSYFEEIGKSIIEKIPVVQNDYRTFLRPANSISFWFNPVTPMEVAQVVENLECKTSVDLYGISNVILKKLAIQVAIPLSVIFNQSVIKGKYPIAWKTSKIVPIFKKKGLDTDMQNYRPIALICTFAKVLEKIMHSRVVNFLENGNYFDNLQFGFRKNRGVNDAFIYDLNMIAKAMDSEQICINLLLDIEKAFDTINRKSLLFKLENAGIRGILLNWFESYLSERKFKVEVGGELSEIEGLPTCGILQGSALSATLFAFFINDLLENLNSNDNRSVGIAYADDLNLIVKGENLNEVREVLESKINLLDNWYNANRISVNAKKTELKIFDKTPNKVPELEMIFGKSGERIRTNDSDARYLGFYLDKKFSFKTFEKTTALKMSRGIACINRVAAFAPKSPKVLLYNSFVHSHLEFSSLLYLSLPSKAQNYLFKLQKKAIRYAYGVKKNAHTANIFKYFRVLPAPVLARYNIFKYMHRLKENENLNILGHFWPRRVRTTERYQLRNKNELKQSMPSRVFYKKLPLYTFSEVYNEIVTIFEKVDRNFRALQEYLMDEYVENNSCINKECFICSKVKKDVCGIELQRKARAERLKKIIMRRGLEKRKRYEKLLDTA